MFELRAIQDALKQFGFDGWLLYDFRGTNVLAQRIVHLDPDKLLSRRWFYMIPADGDPVKLVHRIEPGALDHLPGDKRMYLPWQQLEKEVQALVKGMSRVAMEYSPRNASPYVSKVDGGTMDVVKETGVEIASSGDLIQLFEATLTPEQWQSHQDVEKLTTAAFDLAWTVMVDGVRGGNPATEVQVQRKILDHFEAHDLEPDHNPIVAVNAHSGDPHFEPRPDIDTPIREGDLVMVDLWAKHRRPGAVFSDITKMAFVGKSVPEKYEKVFAVVAEARDAAVTRIRDAFAAGKEIRGYEVDDAARRVVDAAGYGEYFVHRTGHSISTDLHGNGTHMDNLETHDDRLLLPNTLFSVEPGIYMDEFGVRSEVNVFIDDGGGVHVTGGEQTHVKPLLAD